jgi:hypothetical protein
MKVLSRSPALSKRSRLIADLTNSTALSRRQLLGSMALLAAPSLAVAQHATEAAPKTTTSEQALEGMAGRTEARLPSGFQVRDLRCRSALRRRRRRQARSGREPPEGRQVQVHDAVLGDGRRSRRQLSRAADRNRAGRQVLRPRQERAVRRGRVRELRAAGAAARRLDVSHRPEVGTSGLSA